MFRTGISTAVAFGLMLGFWACSAPPNEPPINPIESADMFDGWATEISVTGKIPFVTASHKIGDPCGPCKEGRWVAEVGQSPRCLTVEGRPVPPSSIRAGHACDACDKAFWICGERGLTCYFPEWDAERHACVPTDNGELLVDRTEFTQGEARNFAPHPIILED